jgi:hypothetical protein
MSLKVACGLIPLALMSGTRDFVALRRGAPVLHDSAFVAFVAFAPS